MISSLIGLGASLVIPKIMMQLREQKIRVVHAMPGRLRLQCDSWKNEVVANSLNQNIVKHPLVLNVTASPVTGSLIIEFVIPHISHQELDELIQFIVQTASDAVLHLDAKLMNGMQKTLNAVDHGIKKQTNGIIDFDSLIVSLLVIKGAGALEISRFFHKSILLGLYDHKRKKKGIDICLR